MELKKEMVKDVVCGMIKPKEQMPSKSIYNGKVYYFCTEMDKQIFDKHPNRWIRRDKEKVKLGGD